VRGPGVSGGEADETGREDLRVGGGAGVDEGMGARGSCSKLADVL
jgi:hypothetical protein